MSRPKETRTSPPFVAAKLYSRTSRDGKKYLSGRLGGVRVLIMPNRDKQCDSDPSYMLLFAEASPWTGNKDASSEGSGR